MVTEASRISRCSKTFGAWGTSAPSTGGSTIVGLMSGRLPPLRISRVNVTGWSGKLVCDDVFVPLAWESRASTGRVRQATPEYVPVPSPRPASPVMPAQFSTPAWTLAWVGMSLVSTASVRRPWTATTAEAFGAMVGSPSASVPVKVTTTLVIWLPAWCRPVSVAVAVRVRVSVLPSA